MLTARVLTRRFWSGVFTTALSALMKISTLILAELQPPALALAAHESAQRYQVALPKVRFEPFDPLPDPPPPIDAPAPTWDVRVWSRWEQRLIAPEIATNAADQVDLRVMFHGPDGATFRGTGFWDGAQTFVVRAMFPTPGAWSWTTTSGDPGLRRSGTVVVGPAAQGGPAIATAGALRVASSGRHLAHADGTPFFWLGDTAWDAVLQVDDPTWARYLDARAAQGFSVVQIALAPTWSSAMDRAGNPPFLSADLTQPNPAFWQGLERKVQAANARGLVVLVAGLGDPLAEGSASASSPAFARHIAARLAGDHVILSASFDHPYRVELEEVATAIRQAAPQTLIIQHPGTPGSGQRNVWAEAYGDHGALDLYGNQTGHNNGDRARVIAQSVTWNLSLWRRTPTRPVVNLEAFYDSNGLAASRGGAYAGTAADARAAGYLSMLSGARGYSYGAYGLWRWDADPDSPSSWARALHYPSAAEMTVLRQIFTALPWWDLEPAPDRITNQSRDGARMMALATSSERRLAVGYLPDNASIALALHGMTGPLRVTWVAPTTGERRAGGIVAADGVVSLSRPGPGDWVVILETQ